MKNLIKNHGYVASVFIVILTVFFGQNVAYGLNVADRTPQVRDAIVAAAGVNAPAEVTDVHLSAITALSLGLSDIVSLKTGDFEGLTALQVLLLNNNQLTALPDGVFNGLDSLQVLLLNNNQLTALPEPVFSDLPSLQALLLNDNQLTTLPVGVFSGLTALQHLNLDNNAVAPVGLTVSLEWVAEGQFKAVVPTGATFDIQLPFRIANGSLIGGATALAIPQGSVESETFTVARTPGTLAAVTVEIGALPELPEAHLGYALVASGDLPLVLIGSEGIHPLSDRTLQVRDAIVAAAGVTSPAEVTEAHLAAITALGLGFNDIASLNANDFDGLISLQVLLLNNNALTDIPAGVFSGLTALQYLNLNNNQLTALPETVFNGLTALQVLLLNNSQLTDIPAGVFSGLASLQYLSLDGNQLTALPAGVFSGLASLQYVYLGNNAVDPVPLSVSLEKVGEGQFKAVAPTGAPFDIMLPIRPTNGSIVGGATGLTIPQGHVESEIFTVTRTPGTLPPVTAEIDTLPGLPESHSGYALVASGDLPLVLIRSVGINPLSDRTPQVRDAIVVAAGVTSPAEVTETHLAAITELNLAFSNITALKAGDFDGLTALQVLLLNDNLLTTLPETIFSSLASLQHLNLNNNPLTMLSDGVFSGLASLQQIDLSANYLTFLPETVFSGLRSLQSLNLSNNAVDPIPLPVSLERVADAQFKAVAPTGAPFDIRLPFRITNGRISRGETALTIRQGHLESEVLTVDHTFENLQLVTADIGILPGLPVNHSGYAVVKASEQPLVLLRSDGIHPISDRTPQVRDAIVVAAGVDAPEEVTEDLMSAITALNLGLNNIVSLKAGDFEGLTALQVLLLNNNALIELPAGVFEGLTSLQVLLMDPVELPVSLEKVAEGQFKAVAPTGAPFDIRLPIHIANGDHISGGATTLTIPQGSVESETFTVTRTPGTIVPVTAEIETLPDLPAGHSGYALLKSGDFSLVLIGSEGIHPLTDRTPQVRDAIVIAAGVTSPEEVTEDLMSAITSLNLSLSHIASLNANDFDGLTALQVLFLNNNQLSALPEPVFSGLTALQYLYLENNPLTFLPDNVFSGLNSLQYLYLGNNQLTDLPAGVFGGLTSLQHLDLSANQLTLLPAGVFSGLTALQYLNLNNNALDPVGLTVSLQRVAEGQFKAVMPTGAPFDMLLPIQITNGSIRSGETSLTIPQGHLESEAFTVIRTPGTLATVTANIGTLPGLPAGHSGYTVVQSGDLPLVLIGSEGINPLSGRTPQVRDAIVAAAGVNTPEEVTEDLMSAITALDLADRTIVSLKAGDFEGLTALQQLDLSTNQLSFLPAGVFSGLTALQQLNLRNNALILLPAEIFGGLASLQELLLNNNQLTALPETGFNGLTSLQRLDLSTNRLTFLPAGIFNGLTALESLNLDNNAVVPMALTVSLEKVAEGQFKAVVPTGAPFDMLLPINITNGRLSGGASSLTIPQGRVESETLTVTQTFENLMTVTADIDTLPELPVNHSGYTVVKASEQPIVLIRSDRINPIGDRTPQVQNAIVAAAGVTAAADVTEAHLASITSLRLGLSEITTLNDRDFEGLTALQVLLLNNNQLTDLPGTVFSGLPALQYLNLESNQLTALPAGVFSGLTSLRYLYLANNAAVPMALSVSLEKVADGQFKAVVPTGAPFDMLLPIHITNGDRISGGASSLTIPQGSIESETFSVTRTPGTHTAVTADIGTLPVLPAGHNGYGLVKSSEQPIVLIDAPGNAAPVFTEGDSTTRTVAENTATGTNIGSAIAATDTDNDTLTYTLSGTDAASFRVVSTSGQLQTNAPLDYETKNAYTVVVSVSDGNGGSDRITVTITVTDVNETPTNNVPIFTEGSRTTRSVVENTATGTNIGDTVAATDADEDTLTYGLGGTDSGSFSIVSTTGQLQTRAPLDYETKNTYTVVISVSDGAGGGDSIAVTISVSDVNEAPVFADGETATRAVTEANTGTAGENVGSPVAATDQDGDTLTYTLSGADADLFSIVSTSGQLQTKTEIDREVKSTCTVVITVSDGTLTDSITVTINIINTNEAPVFTEGDTTTRTVAENTAADENIGDAVAATDPDGDELTYTFSGGDGTNTDGTNDFFSIVRTSGQLQTKAALDFETTNAYTFTLAAEDPAGVTDTISVTMNVTDVNDAPVFTDGTPATRAIAENTDAGTDIGTPVAATDQDGDTLTYTLGGDDADAFDIVATSGQLQTRAALDYENKNAYSVTVDVSDSNGGTDSIDVTITVTDINEGPSFIEGASATRFVAENTVSGTNIGDAVAATDADNDTLTYSLGGPDADAFGIVSTTGQLQTEDALDFETKPSYAVTVSVSDGDSGTDSITITITVTDTNDAPVFADGDSTARAVAENTASGQNIDTPVAATDQDSDTLTYSLGGTDAASFSIVETSGQLQTSAALDYETTPSYSVTISVSDGKGGTDSIAVTINITDVIEPPLSERTQQIRDAIVAAVPGVDAADDVTAAHLAAITSLFLSDQSITSLKSGDFNGLTALTTLDLADNSISDISPLEDLTALQVISLSNNSVSDLSPLEGLTTLIRLNLSNNSVSDISALEDLTSLGLLDLDTNSVSDISALENLTKLGLLDLADNSISDISPLEDLTSLTVLNLANNSISDISALEGLTALTRLRLSGNLISDYAPLRRLKTAKPTVNIDININNNPPVFGDGDTATRTVAENTATGTDIGSAIAATDADNDTLTYTLSGTDAASFSIVETSGQLQTKAALDYETKTSYTVTVTVSDGNSGGDIITVTINVTEVKNAPVFTDGDTATRTVAENTATGTNIGTAIAATDQDGDTLTYTLSGEDAASFSIVETSGQLQTKAALDFETQSSYAVTVSVSDGKGGTDSIAVTITVTDVNEIDPPLSERTQQVRNAIVREVPDVTDANDVTDTHLAAITSINLWRLTSLKSGDFNGLTALTQLTMTGQPDYTLSDISPLEGLTSLTQLILSFNSISDLSPLENLTSLTRLDLDTNSVSDVSPLENLTALRLLGLQNNSISDISALEGLTALTWLQLANNSVSDVSPLEELTALTALHLVGNPISDYGPLRRLKTANPAVNIHINLDNNLPVFGDGDTATRAIEEGTATGTNIGDPFSATDADNDTLTYTLGGEDAASFSIVSTTGQLQTKAALDYDTKASYTVTVTAYDGNSGGDRITVTINVTEITETPTNNAPTFTDGDTATRTVAENTDAGQNIGTPVAATDADNDTLTYTLGGTDAASFTIVSTSGQLQTRAALDYETTPSYSVTVSVSDGKGGTDSINVTINVTNLNDNAPVFTEGDTTTRTIAENTATGTAIGTAVAATDADTGDTLTYTLSGDDADAFSIVSTSGQLETKDALDYEKQSSYAVTVSVSDSNSGSDTIDVTISVTDANDAPIFTDGATATRSVDENTAAGTAIGTAVAATDQDSDTLTYSLGGTNKDAFSIVSTSGQLQTKAALDYEDKSSYAVTVSVSDGKGGTDSIAVTINVTDVNEIDPPLSERTQQVRDAIVATANNADDVTPAHLAGITRLNLNAKGITSLKSGDFNGLTALTTLNLFNNSISDVSPLEGLTALTQLNLTNNSVSDLSPLEDLTALIILYLRNNSVSDISALEDLTSLQSLNLANNSISDVSSLEALTALTALHLMGNPISDYGPLRRLKTANPAVNIDINLDNNLPVFGDGDTATRAIEEGTATGTNIGSAIAATDADSDDTLTYTLGGEDAASFSIVSTSGQLQTKAALDYDTKSSYTVTVNVYDGNSGGDSITVTINVTERNNAPVFIEGTSATRSVAEDTATGTNIGAAVGATDADDDTLTYTLGGADAASFSIVSTSGQLQTNAALDYETQTSYAVTVSVSDGKGGTDSIAITINVTNVTEANNAPIFGDGDSTTRSIAENTASGQNIGTVVAATDADNDTLTYSLGGTDKDAFSIVATTGQLQTKDALDHETKTSYSVKITATDAGSLSDTITVTITVTDVNDAPTFTDGDTATRSVEEGTASGTAIGTAVAATDQDRIPDPNNEGQFIAKDTLTYSLSGEDAASFSIVSTSGQLQTKAALDYEEKTSYSVTITVSDGAGGSDSITVTINVTEVNTAPEFTDGGSTTRSVAENTTSGKNIGTAIAATDADNDTLTYTLGGTDKDSFSIVSTSGQLQTKAALDYEDKSSYTVTVSVSDGKGGTDSITVTINITDVDESIDPPLSERTQRVRDAIITAVPGVNNANDVTATHLAAITSIDLSRLTSLKSGDFNGLTALTKLTLTGHQPDHTLSDISPLEGLTSLTRLFLAFNSISDLSPIEGLTSLTQLDLNDNSVSDLSPIEGLTALELLGLKNNSVSDISALEGLTALTWLQLANNSISDVSPIEQLTKLGQLYLVGNPISDYGPLRRLKTAKPTVTIDINLDNNLPVFGDGDTTTRTVEEGTATGTNIGSAIAATDADDDTLTYTLGGEDAASFSIVSTSGQLQTKAALDYDTKASYTVTVTAYDGNSGGDTITVTINVTEVTETPTNNAPTFTDGDTATRTVAENTDAGQNIGTPVSATDADDDTLTYTLGGADASSFSIVETSGQLQTNAALDYEDTSSYSVTISVSDGRGGSDSIAVTINVTNLNDNAPVFTEGDTTTRTIAENTATGTDIGTAVAATDADTGDTLTYTLSGDDADAFSIVSTSGQLQTKDALDYETETSYSVKITATDAGSLSDTITVTITVTDVNDAPTFTEGDTATRTVEEGTASGTAIGTPVAATDQDRIPDPNNEGQFIAKDTLTYSLSGEDAASFSIVSTSGQLQTKAALDYEEKTSYSVTITVSDGAGGSDSITVTINVTEVEETPANNAPSFTEGATATRSVAENTATGTNIGTAVRATDADDDTLTYSLDGTDKDAFSIVATTGQLQTKAALNYEEKTSYAVTVSVSDGNGGSDTIDVTISVTDANDAPVFTDGDSTTRSVAENTASGQNIDTAVAATDADDDTLTYTLGGTDAASFSIVATSGQLQTKAALDYEEKTSYSVKITVSDGNLTDSIAVTINVTDVNEAPAFASGASISNISATKDTAITSVTLPAATDVDDDTITYTLAPTLPAGLAFNATTRLLSGTPTAETASATYTYKASDGTLSASLTFTIEVGAPANNAPVFDDGTDTTRSVAENTDANTDIGDAVGATDADDDTLTYTLGGEDAASFSIVSTSGQLQTKAALNHEAKGSYSVTVSVSDGAGGSDSITVTITVTDVNETPSFSADKITLSVSENAPNGTRIGDAFQATDPDADTLTYSLHRADRNAFGINPSTGQLTVQTVLDYDNKNTYENLAVRATDPGGLFDVILVTVNVTRVNGNNAPIFRDGTTTTRSVAENTAASTNIGTAVAATDADDDTLTYTLGGTNAAAFSIVSTSGQLQTKAALDYETKNAYSVTVSVSDDNGGSDSITVTINVTNVNEIDPPLSERTQEVREAIVTAVPDVTDADDVIDTHLAAITSLSIVSMESRSLQAGDFNGLTSLTTLALNASFVSDISPIEQLTTLTSLNIQRNLISDISPLDDLTSLTTLNISENTISDISVLEHLTKLTYLDISYNAISAISVLEDLTELETLNLIGNPISDYAFLRKLKTDNPDITIDMNLTNNPPTFTGGDTATRSIEENTASDTDIGEPIAATDTDASDTLTYSFAHYRFGNADAIVFSIDATSGQLKTNLALDYEFKTSYTVIVDVSDGNDGLDRITVTINITDKVGAAPSVEIPPPPIIPEKTALLTNYPNPFNPETWIPYQLAKPADVRLTIYDMRGVVVRELKLGHKAAGMYTSRSRAIHWDGRNMFGEKVATGVYFYTLKAGDYTATRKLLIRK